MSSLAVERQYDPSLGRHQACRCLSAALLGWGFGQITAIRDSDAGSCELVAPQGRPKYQLAVEEATILIAGRIGSIIASDYEDVARCNDIAAANSFSDLEAQQFLDLAYQRALGIVLRAQSTGMLDKFLRLLAANHGEINSPWEAKRDLRPLIEVPITVNVQPAESPIINLTVPQPSPTPIVIENSIEQPDRTVVFHRDYSGAITEATIETETEPETTT